MIGDGRENLFEFHFPKTFMPKEVSDKYKRYLNRIPGNIITDPLNFINYTIQGINLPGTGYDAITQLQKPGNNAQWRNSLPSEELYEKELTVTFQLVDGYINYWMMLDILNHYYDFNKKEPYIPDLNLRMLDSEGNSIVTARINRPLIKNISDLNMNFASNVADFSTFDVTLGYNSLEIIVELD